MRYLRFRLFLIFLITVIITVVAQHSGRDSWHQPERIIDSLEIKPGMVIGEAGAGDGYFTFHLAKRVGNTGKIFANDIDRGALDDLEDRAEQENIKNISTLIGEVDDPLFPAGELDMIIMMRAFHDFTEPVAWMKNAASALKPGALMVIIDLDTDKRGNWNNHFLTKEQVLDLMDKTDFELVKIYDFLERDLIFVFKLKEVKYKY